MVKGEALASEENVCVVSDPRHTTYEEPTMDLKTHQLIKVISKLNLVLPHATKVTNSTTAHLAGIIFQMHLSL